MIPIIAQRLVEMRDQFAGQIVVIDDCESTVKVVVIPESWVRRNAERGLPTEMKLSSGDEYCTADDGDWVRVTEPTVFIIDPFLNRTAPRV